MTPRVQLPQASPSLRIARYRAAIDARIAAVLSSQSYILGPEVEQFETAFASYIGAQHCVGVATGTDALALALRALGIGRGDEVVTVSLTAAATASAIAQCGAEPRFIDVDPHTRCMDVNRLSAAITPRTAAIMPVHLHGHPVDMTAVMEIADRHALAVVEDCAQAHGAQHNGHRVGSFGTLAAFSFYPTKNLGCIGDGGAVVTSDAALATRLRALRAYGWQTAERISTEPGWNSRLDELQAGILNVLLPELDSYTSERRAIARTIHQGLSTSPAGDDIELATLDPGSVHHQFAIAVPNRDLIRQHLGKVEGIGTAIHYCPALHQQPAYAACATDELANTELLAARMISLPIQPEVVGDRGSQLIEAVARVVRACNPS